MLITWLAVIAGVIGLITAVTYGRATHRAYRGSALVIRIGLSVGLAVIGSASLLGGITGRPVGAPVLTTLTVLFALVALDSRTTPSADEID